MDPTAALQRIYELAGTDDYDEAADACADLRAWLICGGFPPDLSRIRLPNEHTRYQKYGVGAGDVIGSRSRWELRPNIHRGFPWAIEHDDNGTLKLARHAASGRVAASLALGCVHAR